MGSLPKTHGPKHHRVRIEILTSWGNAVFDSCLPFILQFLPQPDSPLHLASSPRRPRISLDPRCLFLRGPEPRWPCEVSESRAISNLPRLRPPKTSSLPWRRPHLLASSSRGSTVPMLTKSTTAARPINSLAPFRIAAASISSSSRKDASTGAVQQHGGHGLVKRERKEVLLPSQEGTKGVVQYALYVVPSPAGALAARGKIERASGNLGNTFPATRRRRRHSLPRLDCIGLLSTLAAPPST